MTVSPGESQDMSRLQDNLALISALVSYANGGPVPTWSSTALSADAGRLEVLRWLRYFEQTIRLLGEAKSELEDQGVVVDSEQVQKLATATDRAIAALKRRLAAAA